jgi:Protein of unknown function (DUF1761)
MLGLFWILLFLLAAYILLVLPALAVSEFYRRYRGSRAIVCPENQRQVAVGFDAVHAAVTQLSGTPEVRLAECTRWPEHADCGRECLPQALRTPVYKKGEIGPPHKKPIYHLPVLLAAFAAWVLGAVWHSHYLFRISWTNAVGLTRADVHELVWRLAPHLLTFGVPVLFAYSVAWMLAQSRNKNLGTGVADAIFLWAVLGGAAGLMTEGFKGLSADLLWIEIAYTFLASIVVGAVVGGLNGKLIDPTFAR